MENQQLICVADTRSGTKNVQELEEVYLTQFRELETRLAVTLLETRPEDILPKTTELVAVPKPEMNDLYHNAVPIIKEYKTILSEGFKNQAMRTKYRYIDAQKDEYYLTNNNYTLRLKDYENRKAFGRVFSVRPLSRGAIFNLAKDTSIPRGFWSDTKTVWGVVKNNRLPRSREREKIPLFIYEIGHLEKYEVEEVPIGEEELADRMKPILYKKIVGFEEPTEKQFVRALKHLDRSNPNRQTRSLGKRLFGSQLIEVSKERLTYPITPEVMAVYNAAEKSNLFSELKFLTLGEKLSDPILIGEIFGGMRVPLCWWN